MRGHDMRTTTIPLSNRALWNTIEQAAGLGAGPQLLFHLMTTLKDLTIFTEQT